MFYGVAQWLAVGLVVLVLAIALELLIAAIPAIQASIEDIAPHGVRLPLSFLIELLAAIPSVVYGLWGIFILILAVMPLFRWLHQRLGWLPLFNTVPSNRSLLLTILVLTLMILPIVVAMSRDALASLLAIR